MLEAVGCGEQGESPMTNILLVATVAVRGFTATNDVPRWGEHEACDGGCWTVYFDQAEKPPQFMSGQMNRDNANDRVRIVTTKRVTKATFEWNGKVREVVDEEVLEETRTILKRVEEWREAVEGER